MSSDYLNPFDSNKNLNLNSTTSDSSGGNFAINYRKISKELDEDSTCSILEHKGNEGKQTYTTKYYNLDAILSVGYRVNSKNATRFRQWANKVLKNFLVKGYVVNERIRKEQIGESLTEEKDVMVKVVVNLINQQN